MYQWIAKRQIRRGFQQISSGDYEALLPMFAANIHFTFAGNHALGANVHSREGTRQWFARVHKIFPGLKLEAKRIFVAGPPWDMVITTEFQVHDTLPDGTNYRNNGVQVARIRFGQVVEDHLIEDNLVLSSVLARLVTLGHTEAAAAPFRDQPSFA
jgi:ketosteroid isomerase-like protein